jgi:hypothetical protein
MSAENPFEDFESATEHAGEEATEKTTSQGVDGQSWINKLFDGDAEGPPISQLRSDYDLPREICIILRGILRVSRGSGVPPIAEMVLGAVIYVISQSQDSDSNPDVGNLEGQL